MSTELEGPVSEELEQLAPSSQRLTTCAYGPSVFARPGTFPGRDLLVISEKYPNGLRAHRRIIDGEETRFLIAERDLVESDIKRGTLGDFLTEIFLYPFEPIVNEAYSDGLGLQAKTRVVKEEARDLVVQYGEMCRGFVAKPEFFALSRLRKRARAFLPSMDGYLRLLEPFVRERNTGILRDSYRDAISPLQPDVFEMEGENVVISDSTIDRWLAKRSSEQVANILRQGQRTFYSYLTKGKSIYLNLDLVVRELYSPIRMGLSYQLRGMKPEDPRNYLYLRTAEGLDPINDAASLEEVVASLSPGYPITMSPLAGVLNEVILVTVGTNRYVAKRFTDWHGFKWVPLNMVSFGSKLFAVSGKSRMSNEYGINRYLAKKGLCVPEIIHVNIRERFLLESYVSGTSVAEFMSQTINRSALTRSQYQLAEELGETIARIHEVGVSIGDSKPENFVAEGNGICVIDLEQAGKRKDYAWDIAELLFYTGHYSFSPTPTRNLRELVSAFIRGYLRKGNATELRRAAGVRYAKPFSLWTPAPIIFEISRMLKKATS